METLLITIVPSILILLFFVFSDRFREPKKIIIITFLFGILITIPAGYLNDFIIDTFETESEVNNALLGGFFAGGLVEETLKFLVLSPGLILSGEYATLKSFFQINPDIFSIIGIQISSVTPG